MILEKMTDNEIIEWIKDLKAELLRRMSKELGPKGEISLTIESRVIDKNGHVFLNEPLNSKYFVGDEFGISSIINQDSTYCILVDEVINKAREHYFNKLSESIKLTDEEKRRIPSLMSKFRGSPFADSEDWKLFEKIVKPHISRGIW